MDLQERRGSYVCLPHRHGESTVKIHPTPDARADFAQYQLHTAALLFSSTSGFAQLASKARRLQRLAARASRERRWKNEELFA